ncbi:hypothetical protein WQE_32711 [Paraburkholderia hospita]|uniref:Uncharacterized protein n=1 Tax=Paraburkholderia hospita TaxID=169430 RepID=A0ABN0FDJ9_9BURK|nr:hypothetical protein WQE_32711 [Paraburkholderia hospita]
MATSNAEGLDSFKIVIPIKEWLALQGPSESGVLRAVLLSDALVTQRKITALVSATLKKSH